MKVLALGCPGPGMPGAAAGACSSLRRCSSTGMCWPSPAMFQVGAQTGQEPSPGRVLGQEWRMAAWARGRLSTLLGLRPGPARVGKSRQVGRRKGQAPRPRPRLQKRPRLTIHLAWSPARPPAAQAPTACHFAQLIKAPPKPLWDVREVISLKCEEGGREERKDTEVPRDATKDGPAGHIQGAASSSFKGLGQAEPRAGPSSTGHGRR